MRLGKRSPPRGLFEADTLYADFVGRETFHGGRAGQRGEPFPAELFLPLSVGGWGRPSLPPSRLATALVLQTDEGVSDAEAAPRAASDLRGEGARGVAVDAKPFAQSTLREFRAPLLVHEPARALFRERLALAKRRGRRRRARRLKLARDTTPSFGRGAVKDTDNLLAAGIVRGRRVLARQAGGARGARDALVARATAAGYGRSGGDVSVKGAAARDGAAAAARARCLGELVAAADRALEQARAARGAPPAGSPEEAALVEAAGRLSRGLCRDVGRKDAAGGGPAIKEGTAPARLVAGHDPEMRHGRQSAAKRFGGHKAAVAVDTAAQLIPAGDGRAGNAPAAEGARAGGEQSEQAAGCAVGETSGAGADGAGETRPAFADAGRVRSAKGPVLPNHGGFPKTAFRIDRAPAAGPTGPGPGGPTTAPLAPGGRGRRVSVFPAAVCAAGPLRAQCLTEPNRRAADHSGAGGRPRRTGRTILRHPQEALRQAARASPPRPAAAAAVRRRRQAAEHRLARLVQLGVRQARYGGRARPLFQLLRAATVANLTLLAGPPPDSGSDSTGPSGPALAPAAAVVLARTLATCAALTRRRPSAAGPRRDRSRPVPRLVRSQQTATFRPHF